MDWSRLVEADRPWLARLAEKLASQYALPSTGVAWNSSFEEREAGMHDGRTLIGWRARAASPLWSGTLAGDVSLLAVESPNSVGLGVDPRRWLRLALKENWGLLTLGVRVESISPGLERVSGGRVKGEHEGGEAWLEGGEGPLRLRFSGGQFWDNQADYPWQPRTTKTHNGASLDIALPIGGALTLGYQGGLAEREPGRRPRTAQAAESGASAFHSVTTSLSYTGSAWSLTASSTYSPSSDVLQPDRDTVLITHDVSATFRLLPSLTITPTLSLSEETYAWLGSRSQTTAASVSVSWTSILENVDLTVSGSYARNHTTESSYDATEINATAGLVWRLPQGGPASTSLAVEVGSNHYLDRVTPSARYAEVYGVITFRIATF